jgi:hypothetical protein
LVSSSISWNEDYRYCSGTIYLVIDTVDSGKKAVLSQRHIYLPKTHQVLDDLIPLDLKNTKKMVLLAYLQMISILINEDWVTIPYEIYQHNIGII